MSDHKSIKNWAEDERPREKMLQKGTHALTDAELIAILLNSGTREKSALDIAREIIQLANGNLRELGRLTLKDFQNVKGVGEARAITVAAALELGRRRQTSDFLEKPRITGSESAAELIKPLLQDLNHEAFLVVYMNAKCDVMKTEIISQGGLTSTIADIRIILKNALLNNSSNLLIAHNHPSGSLKPSKADMTLTQNMKEACNIMDIKLLDHIIIAGSGYYSFADEGEL